MKCPFKPGDKIQVKTIEELNSNRPPDLDRGWDDFNIRFGGRTMIFKRTANEEGYCVHAPDFQTGAAKWERYKLVITHSKLKTLLLNEIKVNDD